MKTIEELKKQRKALHDMQMREYKTNGNTKESQELFKEIEKIDEQIEEIRKNGGRK